MNTFNKIFASTLFLSFLALGSAQAQTESDTTPSNNTKLDGLKNSGTHLIQGLQQKANSVNFDPFGKNLEDTASTRFQFSLIPFVGTNGSYSGSIINDYSFNLLGGYSAGTLKLEMATLFNINRGDMTGVQMAGLFNQVGGEVDGVQMAGLLNSNLDSVRGVQLAGLANFTTGSVEGVQIAGLANFSPRKVEGVQIAGLTNFAAGDLQGSQIAGLLNFAAKDVTGSQIATFNFGNKVNGFQLGVFNYSESTSGVPVGFLSFVRSGYHTLELSANEVLPLNLAFRTGKREFYNIFFAGTRPEWNTQATWSFGYGVGTSPRLGEKTYLNIEVSSEQLSEGSVHSLNLINRGYIGVEYQAGKRVAVFAGPTLNLRVYDTSYPFHPELFSFTKPTIHSDRYHPEDLGSQSWWGFRAGFRFL